MVSRWRARWRACAVLSAAQTILGNDHTCMVYRACASRDGCLGGISERRSFCTGHTGIRLLPQCSQVLYRISCGNQPLLEFLRLNLSRCDWVGCCYRFLVEFWISWLVAVLLKATIRREGVYKILEEANCKPFARKTFFPPRDPLWKCHQRRMNCRVHRMILVRVKNERQQDVSHLIFSL